MVMSAEVETIYERVSKLEDEIALLRNEIDVIKSTIKNRIKRYEIAKVKNGEEINSIM